LTSEKLDLHSTINEIVMDYSRHGERGREKERKRQGERKDEKEK
jgi:hypothetical protein